MSKDESSHKAEDRPTKAGAEKTAKVHIPRRNMLNAGEDRILSETIHREDRCRDKFLENAMYYRKSRNPTIGELTARDNADFLIPIEQTIKMAFETEKFLQFDEKHQQKKESIEPIMIESRQTLRKLDTQKLEVFRGRQKTLDYELEQMQKVIEFKRKELERLRK